jgi:hypothetical protein
LHLARVQLVGDGELWPIREIVHNSSSPTCGILAD